MINVMKKFALILLLLSSCNLNAGEWEFFGLPKSEILSIETSSENPDCIIAGTNKAYMYLSFNGGRDWDHRAVFISYFPFVSNDSWSADSLMCIVGETSAAGLHISPDFGDTWHSKGLLSKPRRIGFDPVNIGYFYICSENGIYFTDNYGLNFIVANDGLPDVNILDVKGDGANAFEAYAVGETFVAHTTNLGRTWTDMGGMFDLPGYNPTRMEFEPNGPETLYVACYAYLARSTNGGDSWEYFRTPTTNNVALTCHPDKPGHLYIGSVGTGVCMSTDAGENFTVINDGLCNLVVNALELDSNDRLFAGTGNGIYIKKLSEVSSKAVNYTPNIPSENGTIVWDFTVTNDSESPIDVYSELYLISGDCNSGVHHDFDLNRLIVQNLAVGQTYQDNYYFSPSIFNGIIEGAIWINSGLEIDNWLTSCCFEFVFEHGWGRPYEGFYWYPGEWSQRSEIKPSLNSLGNNYPNPFNAVTNIGYSLAEDTHVTLEIFNLLGQKIETLIDDYRTAGNKTVSWDASTYSSGVYLCRLTAGDNILSRKIHLLK